MDEKQYYKVILSNVGIKKIFGVSVNNGVNSLAEVLGFNKYMENLEMEEDKDDNLFIVGTLKENSSEDDVVSLEGIYSLEPYYY